MLRVGAEIIVCIRFGTMLDSMTVSNPRDKLLSAHSDIDRFCLNTRQKWQKHRMKFARADSHVTNVCPDVSKVAVKLVSFVLNLLLSCVSYKKATLDYQEMHIGVFLCRGEDCILFTHGPYQQSSRQRSHVSFPSSHTHYALPV